MIMKPRVLIVDPIHETALLELKHRAQVTYSLYPSNRELCRLIKKTDALVLRSGVKITSEIIAKSENLKVIARAGTGLDNIDLSAARKKKIIVFNIPSLSSVDVAEFAFGMILAVSRKICLADRFIRKNQWKKNELLGFRLKGKTLGIIGCGKIGSAVAKLGRCFDMCVIASVKQKTKRREYLFRKRGISLLSNAKVIQKADFLLLTVPLNTSTLNLISSREFKKMKKTVFLINLSRGKVVNEEHLFLALKNNIIAGAAIDVFSKERTKSPLFKLGNVVLTPHLGAMTDEAQLQIGKELVSKLFYYLNNLVIQYGKSN